MYRQWWLQEHKKKVNFYRRINNNNISSLPQDKVNRILLIGCMFSVWDSQDIKKMRNERRELLSFKATSSNAESVTFPVTEYHRN